MKDQVINQLSSLEESNWWIEGRKRITHDIIEHLMDHSIQLKILDVGCGPGGTTKSFLKWGQVYGVDLSTHALKKALKKNISIVINSNLTSIPIKSKQFDVITALDVIEHIKEDSKVLLEFKRILKDDGILIVTVPAFQFLWSEHDVAVSHERRYTSASLKRVFDETGYRVIRISYFVSFVFPLVLIYRFLKKFNLRRNNPKANVVSFPKIVDKILQKTIYFENFIIKKMKIPFGVSLICVVKKHS